MGTDANAAIIADRPAPAEVFMQKNTSKHNRDGGIQRTEHNRLVQTSRFGPRG